MRQIYAFLTRKPFCLACVYGVSETITLAPTQLANVGSQYITFDNICTACMDTRFLCLEEAIPLYLYSITPSILFSEPILEAVSSAETQTPLHGRDVQCKH